jgi:hypothetical protein
MPPNILIEYLRLNKAHIPGDDFHRLILRSQTASLTKESPARRQNAGPFSVFTGEMTYEPRIYPSGIRFRRIIQALMGL